MTVALTARELRVAIRIWLGVQHLWALAACIQVSDGCKAAEAWRPVCRMRFNCALAWRLLCPRPFGCVGVILHGPRMQTHTHTKSERIASYATCMLHLLP